MGKPIRENQAATLFLVIGHGALRFVLTTSTVVCPVLTKHSAWWQNSRSQSCGLAPRQWEPRS